MENAVNIFELMDRYGISFVIVGLLIVGAVYAIRKMPKLIVTVIDAYTKGNDKLVNAVKELSNGLSARIDKLETKVDTMDDKIVEIDVKIDKLANGKE